MYLNRFVIKMPDESAKHIEISKHLGMLEEFIFHFLPKKVNMGGYGFFCLEIYTSQQGKNEIKAYGQCLDFYYRELTFQSEHFACLTFQQQFYLLLDIIGNALKELSSKFEIDKEKFDFALTECRSNYPLKAEQILKKVSKLHKSRKLRINFFREFDLNGESICYRIIDKNNAILKEQIIQSDSSIYDASYGFRSSQWCDDKLLVFNRFDRQTLELDLSEYVNNNE